jgi:hypothetical protein
LADELTAQTLLDRALASDKAAATQFLQELGIIDQRGRLTGIYAPQPTNQLDYCSADELLNATTTSEGGFDA